MRRGADRRQFPVGQMRGKDQRRLAIIGEAIEALCIDLAKFDAARPFRVVGVVVPQPVKLGKFGGDAAEIVP